MTEPFVAGARLPDYKQAVVDPSAVQNLYGAATFGSVSHLDISETLRLSGEVITDEVDLQDRAMGAEKGAEVNFGHVVAEISDVKFHPVSPVSVISRNFDGNEKRCK